MGKILVLCLVALALSGCIYTSPPYGDPAGHPYPPGAGYPSD
jgi:hypothetical protein